MKRILFFFVLCLCVISVSAQSSQFETMCILQKGDSINVYQDLKIDSITFTKSGGDVYQNVWMKKGCRSYDIKDIDSISFVNFYDSGISSMIVQDNGIWDYFYTTPIGTLAYKSSLIYEEDGVKMDDMEVLSYIGEDWQTTAFLIADKEYHLPVRLVMDTVMVYYSYTGDSIVSVALGGNDEIRTIGCYNVDLQKLNDLVATKGYSSIIKELLFKLTSVFSSDDLGEESLSNLLTRLKSLLDKEEHTITNDEIDPKKSLVLVKVYKSGDEPKQKGKGNLLYSAVVNTNRHYDITNHSCIAEGSVSCAYSNFNEDCTYGILFDENPGNLYIGKSAYMVPGLQERFASRFAVNVSGLQAATTYYYRAYLKIKADKYAASPLVIKYDNGSHEEEGYDSLKPTETYGDIKNFTTELPDIAGTWTCKETHYYANHVPYEVTYSLTFNKNRTVIHSEYNDLPSSSWGLSTDGKVVVDIMTLASQTVNSGKKWNGSVDNIKNPTKITGYTATWNFNQNGFYQGDSYAFEMTR